MSRPRCRRPDASSASVSCAKRTSASPTNPSRQMRRRRLDPALAVARGRLGLGDEPPPRRRQRRVAEALERPRHRQVELRGGRPRLAEERLEHADLLHGAGRERVPVLRVADREAEDVGEPERAEVAQHQHPGVEGARARPPAGSRCRGSARSRARRARARSWPPRARRPARRGRAARRGRPTRRARARRRQARSWCGSTTWSTSPAATAASNALPPCSSTAIPDAEASQCVDATIPKEPRSSGRVVNTGANSLTSDPR